VTAVETKAPTEVRKFPLTTLIAMVVGSRREQNRRAFSPAELVICVIAAAGAITGIAALATGAITI
jgi:arginine:ornithine antiporter/lysine permease